MRWWVWSQAAAAVALVAALLGAAEVKSATAAGFELETKVLVKATPEDAYTMLDRVGEWWDPDHSYLGSAANLTLRPQAGACFCERLPGGRGSIEHMRVIHARPGKVLRLQGGLGPLQGEAVAGTLTWSLAAVAGSTEITQNYIVGGYVRGGAERLAPLVDGVLVAQLRRLQARLAR